MDRPRRRQPAGGQSGISVSCPVVTRMRTTAGSLCLLSLALCGLVQLGCKENNSNRKAAADDALCRSNLRSIRFQIEIEAASSINYVPDLQRLANSELDLSKLVCPSTGHSPGGTNNIGEWTDYIYVGNLHDTAFDVAMIICPPENHGGRVGHVAYVDMNLLATHDANTVRQLIGNPWMNVRTNAPWGHQPDFDSNAVVHVPPRLREFYEHSSVPRQPN